MNGVPGILVAEDIMLPTIWIVDETLYAPV